MSDLKTLQQAITDQQQTLNDLDGQAKAILDKAQKQIDGEKGKGAQNESAATDAIARYSQMHSETNQYEYLVRGAALVCRNGSHKRKVNLPKCHGVYVGEHPVLHELECVTELECGPDKCNVTYFGVCTPEEGAAPPETPDVVCVKTTENSKDGTAGEAIGKRCAPKIIGTWQDTYSASRIVDNGDKNQGDRKTAAEIMKNPENANLVQAHGQETITTGSFLVCFYGGIIEPITSGQGEPIEEKDFKNKNDYEKVRQAR